MNHQPQGVLVQVNCESCKGRGYLVQEPAARCPVCEGRTVVSRPITFAQLRVLLARDGA